MKIIKSRLFLALGLMSLCSPALAAGRMEGPAEFYILLVAGVFWVLMKLSRWSDAKKDAKRIAMERRYSDEYLRQQQQQQQRQQQQQQPQKDEGIFLYENGKRVN